MSPRTSAAAGESFRVAVIDLGTNAVRLQIARILPHRRHEIIAEEREEVRLGEGLFQTGELSPQAMERTVAAIARFAKLARHARVHSLRAVATAAVREAHNRTEFIRTVAREAGVALEVIAGAEEARLIARGVTTDRAMQRGDHLLVDIGGGSTEFTLVQAGEAQSCWSLEIGAVRLTELFLAKTDPPTKRDVERLRLYIRSVLAKIPRRQLPASFDLVGSAGTIGAIAEVLRRQKGALRKSLPIRRGELDTLFSELSRMSVAQRRKIPGLDERRAEIVVAGAAILLEAMERVGVDQAIPTRRGLRDGLVVDLVARVGQPLAAARKPEHLIEEGLRALLRRCGADESHADRVNDLALQLFDGVASPAHLDPQGRELLHAAALLHDIGRFVAYEQHHKHSFYLISHADLPGYSEHERELIAHIVRYHRKSPPRAKHVLFQELPLADQDQVRKLAAILRVADSLDRSRRGVIRKLQVHADDRNAQLVADVEGDAELERWAVEDRAAPIFEAALGLGIRLELHPAKRRTSR